MLRLIITLLAICVLAVNGIALTDPSPLSSAQETWSPPVDTGGYHEVFIQVDPSTVVIESGIKFYYIVLAIDPKSSTILNPLGVTGWLEGSLSGTKWHQVVNSEMLPLKIADLDMISLIKQFPVKRIVINLHNYREYGKLALTICLPPASSTLFEKECHAIKVIRSVTNKGFNRESFDGMSGEN